MGAADLGGRGHFLDGVIGGCVAGQHVANGSDQGGPAAYAGAREAACQITMEGVVDRFVERDDDG